MGKGIKTRVSAKKGIKAIDKAAVASERMKEAYIRTKDKADHSLYAEESSPGEYASDRLSAGVDNVTHEAVHQFDKQGRRGVQTTKENCALPGFVDSKNEEKTERNAGYLVVSHSGGGMLRQGTRKGIRRTPANRGMRAHRIVKSLDISEDVCHGMCP